MFKKLPALLPEKSGSNVFCGKSYTPLHTVFSRCKEKMFYFLCFYKKATSKQNFVKTKIHTLIFSWCGVVWTVFYTAKTFLRHTLHLGKKDFLGCKNFAVFVLKFFIYTLKYMLHPDFYINIFLKNNIRGGKGKNNIYQKKINITHAYACERVRGDRHGKILL